MEGKMPGVLPARERRATLAARGGNESVFGKRIRHPEDRRGVESAGASAGTLHGVAAFATVRFRRTLSSSDEF